MCVPAYWIDAIPGIDKERALESTAGTMTIDSIVAALRAIRNSEPHDGRKCSQGQGYCTVCQKTVGRAKHRHDTNEPYPGVCTCDREERILQRQSSAVHGVIVAAAGRTLDVAAALRELARLSQEGSNR